MRSAGTNTDNAARVAFPKAPNGMIRIAPCESLVTVTVQRRQSNGWLAKREVVITKFRKPLGSRVRGSNVGEIVPDVIWETLVAV